MKYLTCSPYFKYMVQPTEFVIQWNANPPITYPASKITLEDEDAPSSPEALTMRASFLLDGSVTLKLPLPDLDDGEHIVSIQAKNEHGLSSPIEFKFWQKEGVVHLEPRPPEWVNVADEPTK